MRLIGSISNPQDAETFSAWLTAEGFENHIDHERSEFQIWVKDEDRVAEAGAHLERFLANPSDARFGDAKRRAAIVERERVLQQRRQQQNIQSRRLGQNGNSGRTPLTFTLLTICLIVALFTSFGEQKNNVWFQALAFSHLGPEQLEAVVNQTDVTIDSLKFWSIRQGELWRLITPIFLHYGLVHLIFNMIWLVQLGRLIEQRFGSTWLLLLVLGAAALGNAVECLIPVQWGGIQFGLTAGHGLVGLGGMSGVIYALFGFVWIRSMIDPESRFFIPTSTVVVMLGWLVFCMLPQSQDMLGAKVANWTHLIGLIVGVAAAYLGYALRKRRLN